MKRMNEMTGKLTQYIQHKWTTLKVFHSVALKWRRLTKHVCSEQSGLWVFFLLAMVALFHFQELVVFSHSDVGKIGLLGLALYFSSVNIMFGATFIFILVMWFHSKIIGEYYHESVLPAVSNAMNQALNEVNGPAVDWQMRPAYFTHAKIGAPYFTGQLLWKPWGQTPYRPDNPFLMFGESPNYVQSSWGNFDPYLNFPFAF